MSFYLTRLQAPYQFPTPYQVHLMAGALAGKQPSRRQCLHYFNHSGVNAEMWLLTKEQPVLGDTGPWKAEVQRLDLSHIEAGQRLGFRVRFNPSICVQGKRQDLVEYVKKDSTWAQARIEAVQRWFAQREESLGFKVDEFILEGHRWKKFDKPGAEPIEFGELDVVGVLTVTDKDKILYTVENGVGRERSFGCGLLFLYEME